MVLLLGGRVPVSNKVSEGDGGDSKGDYQFFTHTKKETEQSKISLSCNSPAALDAPFARFAPAALKYFWHPGGGAPIFDSDSEGGYQNLTEIRGGYAFFKGTFPEKDHPPPYEKF